MDELTRRAMMGGKHCPHCMDGEALTSDAGQHDFRIMGDGLFYFDSQLGWEGVTINFCPWCGKTLTEAEKELL